MGYDGPGIWGLGWFGQLVSTIIGGLLALFALLVVAGLIFLLVRFLIVATRAAQLYVDNHGPAKPTAHAESAAAPTTKPAPTTKAATTTAPATKPRTPKAPPAS
jgi:predicted lipid-binding transport protein (Tim44 family)